MQKTSYLVRRPLMGLICSTIGHDYIVTRKITNHINEYKCASCAKEVSDSYSGKFEDLTYKRREINEGCATCFQEERRVSLQ